MPYPVTAINPHAVQPTSLMSLVENLGGVRQRIVKTAKLEVVGRYKCSVIGLAWLCYFSKEQKRLC